MRCTLREISENLDPRLASRVASSRSTVLSAPAESPAVSMSSESKAFSKTASKPQLEWTPPGTSAPKRSNSRYIVQALAFVVALAAVIAVPRFFRHAHQPLDPDPIEAAAPAAEKPTPAPEAERPRTVPKAEAAPLAVAKKVSPASASAPPAVHVAASVSAPTSAPPKSVTPANSTARAAVRGQVVHQVLPDVSQRARDTIHGKVRVSVKLSVDPSGKVTNAALDSPGPSKYFSDAALHAAKNWTFAPAKANGENVASEWLLRFEFAPDGTATFPAEINP
jgi:protein TonB